MKNKQIEKLNFDGWPLPNEYLIEIGRLAALWSSLEAFLNLCIGKLAGFNDIFDPKPFILIKHSSFPQKIDMLGTLCEQIEHEHKNLSSYKEIISLLRKAQKTRNKYMHNGMSLNPDTGLIEMPQMSARGKLKINVEVIEIADIKRASVEIDEAQTALYKLVLGHDIGPVWKRRQDNRMG